MSKIVYVGLSGGVDSSLTAALLKKEGFKVVGVYMKNWTKDILGYECPWKEDYRDAKRVAVNLDIPFKVFDFEKQYRKKVVDYMIEAYKAGLTPNPDIMCNQEIKFKLFLDTAISQGADLVATGHYARIKNNHLMMAKDQNKDQTYFLYRMSQEALSKSLMPIGDYLKKDVRKLAQEYNLPTYNKKDSQGICFVGEVGIKDFLISELGDQEEGPIIDQEGQVVGQHEGAIFYTIGQRHGLKVASGLPYYVIRKDVSENIVYVTNKLDDQKLWSDQLNLENYYETYSNYDVSNKLIDVRIRHRAPLVKCYLEINKTKATVKLQEPLKATSPGQSAIFYDQGYCIGGGIIV